MRTYYFSILSIVFIFICIFARPERCNAEVELFGVTIGKQNNLRECKIDSTGTSGYENYNIDDCACYTRYIFEKPNDGYCSTRFRTEVSFCQDVDLRFKDECNRNSEVIFLYGDISPANYEIVLNLMTKKFGKPNKIKKSIVSTRIGKSYKQEEAFWTIEGCELYLARYGERIDLGVLTAASPFFIDRKNSLSKKRIIEDATNF